MKTRTLKNEEGIIHVSLRMGKDLHTRLRRYAFEHNKSLSLVMEEAIKEKVSEERNETK